MSEMLIAGVLLTVLFVSLAAGMWISFSLLLVSVSAYFLAGIDDWGRIIATISWGAVSSWTLAPLPMFLWMGEILLRSGLARNLFDGLSVWLNRIPGRLFHVNVLASGLFAAVCGSSAATVATVGKVSLPHLKRLGYRESFALATLGGAGTLGLLIPPSIMMIIYGVAAETSVSRLFMAGVFPGIMVLLLFMGYTIVYNLIHQNAAPAAEPDLHHVSKWRATWKLLPVIALIVGVLGSIYGGIASPTEASAIGVLGALVLSWCEGSLSWKVFREGLMATVKTSTMLLFIIAAASVLTNAMGFIGLPQALAEYVAALNLPPGALVLVLSLLFIVLGCFLDGISVILLTTATILPMVEAAGIDLIWFGIYLVIIVEMAQITPPVGFNLFVLQALSGKDPISIARDTLPFFLILILVLVLIWYFPELVTWLPQTMTATPG